MSELKVRADGVAWQEVDDDLIVLDEHRSTYMRLGGSATVLWPLLVDGTTVDDLARQLVARYEIDSAQARGDVDVFVKSLRDNDLLETVT